jgi:hypothetical protein
LAGRSNEAVDEKLVEIIQALADKYPKGPDELATEPWTCLECPQSDIMQEIKWDGIIPSAPGTFHVHCIPLLLVLVIFWSANFERRIRN